MRQRSDQPRAMRFAAALADSIEDAGNTVTVSTPTQPGMTPLRADRTYACGMWPISPFEAGSYQPEGGENVAESQPYAFNFECGAKVYVGDILTPKGSLVSWKAISALVQSINDTALITHVVGVRI